MGICIDFIILYRLSVSSSNINEILNLGDLQNVT